MSSKGKSQVFGDNLRRIRTARGMSQQELATKLGYTNRSSINKIEVNGRDLPRSKVLLAAEVLGVSPLELCQNTPIEFDESLVTLMDFYNKLNTANKMKALGYIQALYDSQDGEK